MLAILPPLYPAVPLYKYWFMASTIPYLCTALCPVFGANPHAGRDGDIDALVESLAQFLTSALPFVPSL